MGELFHTLCLILPDDRAKISPQLSVKRGQLFKLDIVAHPIPKLAPLPLIVQALPRDVPASHQGAGCRRGRARPDLAAGSAGSGVSKMTLALRHPAATQLVIPVTCIALAKPDRSAPNKAGEGQDLQPPAAVSVRVGPAAQPRGWVQGRSALPGELFSNSIVGPYCVCRATGIK